MIKKQFYDVVRAKYGPLSTEQVKGFELILNEALKRGVRWDNLAYILATVWHETGFTMQPIKEYGGEKYLRSKKYWPYFGRGYVQLTWDYNYEKASKYFGVDFLKNPDLVMLPEYAIPILFVGMERGWFTGKDFDDYLDGVDEDDKEDLREFSNARRIVNGTDKQVEIGRHALVFKEALRAGNDFQKWADGQRLESTEKPADGHKDSQATDGKENIFIVLLRLLIKLLTGGR